MRFKDYIKESIIDIPRQRYAPGVFDDADTNNPKLKQSVRDIILNQIDKFQEKYPVKKYSLIGSILTKRYRDDADLDMNGQVQNSDIQNCLNPYIGRGFQSSTTSKSAKGKGNPNLNLFAKRKKQ